MARTLDPRRGNTIALLGPAYSLLDSRIVGIEEDLVAALGSAGVRRLRDLLLRILATGEHP